MEVQLATNTNGALTRACSKAIDRIKNIGAMLIINPIGTIRYTFTRVFSSNPLPLLKLQSGHGVSFALNPCDHIDLQIMLKGTYERDVLDAVIAQLKPADCFWDIGANFGLHSFTIKKIRMDVSVYAFEPAPVAAAKFLLNQKLNPAADVNLITVPLYSNDSVISMSIRNDGNSGLSSLKPWSNVAYDSQVLVSTKRGDEFLKIIPPPNVIKLDVEGLEHAVLLGMPLILKSNGLRAIIYEDNGSIEMVNLLNEYGFKISKIDATNRLAVRA